MVIPPSFCWKTKKNARKSVLSGGAGWRFEPTADIQFVVVNETSLFFNADFARFLTLKQGPKQRGKKRETIAITRFLRVVVNIP